jgi:EAL domain-containing protein (putative c-di-GMP-specific phosphodiesterase class I)
MRSEAGARTAGQHAEVAQEWAAELADACSGHGVSAAYQPIVDLARGVTVGFEALARFDHPQRLGPDVWLARARNAGCAAELEATCLRSALSARPLLPPNCFLTVNVSPDLLAANPIRAVWADEGDLSGLVIELTEQAPIEDYRALEGDLTALRTAGALIAVDDAGAGYAGLRHLLALRPAIIKLDRELIRDVDVDQAKLALVEMLGVFAGRIDAWMLAEGIERPGELAALADLGVPLGQGYALARPGPHWPDLQEAAVSVLRERDRQSANRTVRGLIETVPFARNTAEAAALSINEPTGAVVLLDQHDRPHSLYHRDLALLGPGEPAMRINVDTHPRDALLRATTREPGERFQPLLCTDNAGRYLGIVRMERLINALADSDQNSNQER